MAKNYMADVAKVLGVKLGEEFKIDGSNSIYKFAEKKLIVFWLTCLTWTVLTNCIASQL